MDKIVLIWNWGWICVKYWFNFKEKFVFNGMINKLCMFVINVGWGL